MNSYAFALPACAALVLCRTAPAVTQERAVRHVPLRIDSVRVVGEDAVLGSTIGARMAPNGTVYVADHINAQVVAFSPDGRFLWRAGRKGGGPGEFQIPYRIAVRADGKILVFDRATGEITLLSPEGRFVDRFRLPFYFSQVDGLAELPNGQLVVAGTTEANERVRRHGLHRFRLSGREFVHAGSFGHLPNARDRAVLRFWGAGPIHRASNGDLLYVRRIPYEVYRFDPSGRLLRVLRPPFKTRGTPDDVVRIERREGGMTITSTDADIERPGTVSELPNGWILVTRISRGADYWDFFSPSGRYAGSRRVPEEWGASVGYNRSRGILWLTGTHNSEPVLLKVYVSS